MKRFHNQRLTTKLFEIEEDWGAGWYNVDSGQLIMKQHSPHADIILKNPETFDINVDSKIYNDEKAFQDASFDLDGKYDYFYNDGWLRFLWANEDPKNSMLGASGTPGLLQRAWDSNVIPKLINMFSPTLVYFDTNDGERFGNFELPRDEDLLINTFEDDEVGGDTNIDDLRRKAGIT